MKLLEEDLGNAEDRIDELNAKYKQAESDKEEFQRENASLKSTITNLEGKTPWMAQVQFF